MQTIVAYVPALHKGYIEFFKKFPGDLYLLDIGLIKEVYPKIERDFRAIPAADMAKAIEALKLLKSVTILDKKSLVDLTKAETKIVMPDEDISHLVAKKYLNGKDIEFVNTHLRWDGWSAVKETPVPPDRVVSTDEKDKELMGQAFTQAKKSPDWWRQVGAVIAKDSKPMLVGHNRPEVTASYSVNAYGDPRSNFDAGVSYDLSTAEHGEAHLIAQAARTGQALEGTSIYATTFPCPTCAKLIVSAGIKKVYYTEGYSLVDAEELFRKNDIEIILVKG